MSHKKKLIENISSLMILQGANYVLPIIVVPYLMRVLGAEKYGLIVFAQAFTQYFVVLTDYGFNLTATRQIALQRDNLDEVSEIFSTVLIIKFGFMLLSFLLMAVIVCSVSTFRPDWQVYFIAFLTVIGNAMFPVWLFQGMESMRYITVLNISAKTIALLCIFVFVHSRSDYLIAAGLQSSGFVLAGLVGLWVARRHIGVRLIRPHKLRNIGATMREGAPIFIATLSGNVYGQGSVLITGLLAGHAAAGYYSVAQKIAGAIANLIQPVSQSVYPHVTQLFASDQKAFRSFRTRTLLIGGMLALVTGSTLFITSPWVAQLVSGSSSPLLIGLLRILSVMLIFTTMNVLITPFILSMRRYGELQRMYMTVAVLFLMVSIPAVRHFGAPGMAVTMIGVEIFVFLNGARIARIFA